MSEVEQADTDHAEPVEPLGIKQPLRSPTALGQSKFLMPLGMRSLSVLQPIAVHPQVDDFDFSSIQVAEPVDSPEPKSTPSLQLSSLPKPQDSEGYSEKSPETNSSARISAPQQKPSALPKSHPGTGLPRPVQGVVQFFKSVLGRKDSSPHPKNSAPEFLPGGAQPISDTSALIQLQVTDSLPPISDASLLTQHSVKSVVPLSELPPARSSSKLASSSFADNSNSTIQQRLGSDLDIQRQTETVAGGADSQALTQKLPVSSLETQQLPIDEEVNLSESNFPSFLDSRSSLPKGSAASLIEEQNLVQADPLKAIAPALPPFLDSRSPLQENVDSSSIEGQNPIQADPLKAIAPAQVDLDNALDLKSQETSPHDFLIPPSGAVQLEQENKLDQELPLSFSLAQGSAENLISSSETTAIDTDLGSSIKREEVSTGKNESVEFSQIQRQSEQIPFSAQPPASTEISTETKLATQPASNNQQIIQQEDHTLRNQHLSVIQAKHDDLKIQNQPEIQEDDVLDPQRQLGAIDSIFPVSNDVEINTFQAKQENNLEQTSYSLETDAAKQSEPIQSLFPPRSTKTEEIDEQIGIQQPVEAPIKNKVEAAIGFTSEVEQQEITPPSLQLREDHSAPETSESFLESTNSIESITPISSQIQPSDTEDGTSISRQFPSSVEEVDETEIFSSRKLDLPQESEALQRKSDDDLLNSNASSNDRPVSAMSNDTSVSNHDAAPALNDVSSNQSNFHNEPDTLQRKSDDLLSHGVASNDRHASAINHDSASLFNIDEPFSQDASSPNNSASPIKVNHDAFSQAQESPVANATASPDVLQLQEERAEVLNLPFEEFSETLLLDNSSAPSESPPQDRDSLRVAKLSLPKIQRQVENTHFPDTAEVTRIEKIISSEEAILPEENLLGSESATVQRQSNSDSDRKNESPVSASQNSLEPTVLDVSANSISLQELELQRQPAPESTQTVTEENTEENANPIHSELYPRATPYSQSDAVEAEIAPVLSDCVEEETRSLQDPHQESPPSLNAPTTENLSSLEIQRQPENFISDSQGISENFPGFEAENHSGNKSSSTPRNDSKAFVAPSMPDSLQMKSEPPDELTTPDRQNLSSTASFNHHPDPTTASHPGSEPPRLSENISATSSQPISDIPDVQAASASATRVNEAQADSTSVEESVVEGSESVPDPVTSPSPESAHSSRDPQGVAPSTSDKLTASDRQNPASVELFASHPEPLTASGYPSSEPPHLSENSLAASSQSTSNIPAASSQPASNIPDIQAASISSIHTNETPANFTDVEESVVESSESVPDRVTAPSPESAHSSRDLQEVAPPTVINSARQFNNFENSDFTYPLTDLTPSSPNIQSKTDYSDPAIQNTTLPNAATSNQAEIHSDPAFQSATEHNDNPLQSSFPESQQHRPQDLQQSALDQGNVNFQAESIEKEVLSSLLPSNLEPKQLLENPPHPSIQLEQDLESEIPRPEASSLLESNHPGSDPQSLINNSSDVLNSPQGNVSTDQTASISPSSAATITPKNQDQAAIETNNLSSFQSLPKAYSFANNAGAVSSENEVPIALSAADTLENSNTEEHHQPRQDSSPLEDGREESPIVLPPIEAPVPFLALDQEPDVAIQQRSIENTEISPQLANSVPLQELPSIPTTERLHSSLIQQPERFEPNRHASLELSPYIQLNSESNSEDIDLSVEPLIPHSVKSLSSSLVHPGSDIQHSTDDSETAAEHEKATSQRSPDIQLQVEDRSSVAGSRVETSNDLPSESSSEAIAQPLSESAIVTPFVEPSSEAIGNTWDASSSYSSTPNGRRDAHLAAPEEQPPVENEIQVLPNTLSSDVQRFVDNSLEQSSAAQLSSKDQAEIVTPSSSKSPADLPQLPRFLQDLTVLKPLVQRSSLTVALDTVAPENTTSESAHADALNVLSGNSSEAIAQPFNETALAIPSTEQTDQAIGNTWNSSSSYDATPNGRRDMQHNVSENHSTAESTISPILPNLLDSDIQRVADNDFEHSSTAAQPDSAGQSEAVNLPASQLSADLPQLPRFLQDLTVLKPLVQRSLLTIPLGSVHAKTSDELPLGSSSEAIAQTTSEPANEFSSLAVKLLPIEPLPIEPHSQAIANTGNAASSYDSTPNGRRDAQIAASQNHSPAESESPHVLPNAPSSNIQRFIDDSSDHSSFFTQSSSSQQSETVNSSPSQLSADLPQLPRFLQDLTVLKPLVQRSLQVTHQGSPLHESSEELSEESPSNSTLQSPQNSSSPVSSPFSGGHNSAIVSPQSATIQPVSTPAQTPASAPLPAHPGTAPSTWSSLAELVNPKPPQPQQPSENHYSPLASNLLQAKFATPILQRASASSDPIEVPNAPTTTLSASDFQPEAPLDTLLETLAQEIYGLLRQKMEIERERQGRSLGRMPW